MAQEEWEYFCKIVYAHIDNPGAREYIKKKWPDWTNIPKFAPQTMNLSLNDSGSVGWELVQMQPVVARADNSVTVPGANMDTNAYFCVFKRRMV